MNTDRLNFDAFDRLEIKKLQPTFFNETCA